MKLKMTARYFAGAHNGLGQGMASLTTHELDLTTNY